MAPNFSAIAKSRSNLNIAFIGYEVSKITQKSNTNPPQIIEIQSVEKSESSTHLFIVLSFGVSLCISLIILCALRVIFPTKKSKRDIENQQPSGSHILK